MTPSASASSRRGRFWFVAGIGVPAAIVVAWALTHTRSSEFDQFWGPVMNGKAPITIAFAPDQAGFADAVTAARVFSLCALRGRKAEMRPASEVNPAGLGGAWTILIGRPASELATGLRFRMAKCEAGPCVADSVEKREWAAGDYILITRLPRSHAGGMVIAGAGLTAAATEEAGRILTEPEVLAPVLAQLAAGWKDRDLQVVLRSKIAGDMHPSPELITSHLW